ncbi:Cadherin-23 [Manis pentadactyla]|nr:Cadherin-23 [Manis pentadactyla]
MTDVEVYYDSSDVEGDGVVSGSSSYVSASVRLSRRVNGVIADINSEEKTSFGLWLGSSSDVKCQILAPGLGLALVLKVKCQILAPGLGLALVVRDISIMERVRFCVLCDGECKTLDQGYGEVSDPGDRASAGISYVEGDGVLSETLALRKVLGFGSDVLWNARWWIRVMTFKLMVSAQVTSMLTLRFQVKGPWVATLKLMVSAQGEGQIDVHHRGVASVTSMLMLRIQVNRPGLDVEVDGVGSGYGVERDMVRFVSYSDTFKLMVSAQVTSMLTLRFQVKGPWVVTLKLMVSAQGEGKIDVHHRGVASVTSMLMLRIQVNRPGLDFEVDGVGSGYGVERDMVRFASYSDTFKLMVSAQVTSMLTLRFQVKGPWVVTLKLMVSAQGEGQIDVHHRGVASVTSMLTLRIQTLKLMVSAQGDYAIQFQDYSYINADTEVPSLGTLVSDVEADGISSGYGVERDTVRIASYSDVKAKARFIFIIVVWHR